MATSFITFPAAKEAEALAYQAWANGSPQNPFHPAPYAYCRNDAFGNWIVPYLGPPFEWNGVLYLEPEGGEAMRAAGVLVDEVTWSEDE
jgi:hypothetical protein